MSFKKHGRQYDLIVLGATARHGTSEPKLILPNALTLTEAIEICNLNNEEVSELAKKTFCLITTVGPYALHGEYAFRACAETGTHYIDCTPEVPWTLEMIKKYEATAKASGAWMIPQCAMESAPSDILTWAVAEEVRSEFSSRVGDIVMDQHQLTSIPSGGTLATILNLFGQYPLKTLLQSIEPYALSPVPNGHPLPKRSRWSSLTGVHKIAGLPLLSTSISGKANAAIVSRTWGLFKQEPNLKKEFYGPEFTYQEYMYAPGFVRGMLMHYFLVTGGYLLLLAPVRASIRRFVTKPGDGPDTKKAKEEVIELRAVAKPASKAGENRQVLGKLTYHGSMYFLTATFLAEAAATMLEEDDSSRLTGGIYTPACLGQGYIDRLRGVGVQISTEIQNL
uniref:Putative trans-acting enoyl reductase n=1 Tax=Talaromyces marneffei PM1 TaxID=1077442 RepID=A0A093UYJ1_TALMA